MEVSLFLVAKSNFFALELRSSVLKNDASIVCYLFV